MSPKLFKQINVFSINKYDGNPVAVFFDADDLSSEEMLKIANWTNLSETTFVLKPTAERADYKLRIFTPTYELPFAGHPTIGSAHAVIESGLVKPKNGKVVQECSAGLVELDVTNDSNGRLKLTFTLPYFKAEGTDAATLQSIEQSLNLSPGVVAKTSSAALIDDGPKWFTIELESADDVNNLKIDFEKIHEITQARGWAGYSVFGKYPDGTYEARNLCPNCGPKEDPVCGSGAGADAALLATYSNFTGDFIIRQGQHLGRDGRIYVNVSKGNGKTVIKVGGNATTAISGTY